jgi:MoxR-like ATPase
MAAATKKTVVRRKKTAAPDRLATVPQGVFDIYIGRVIDGMQDMDVLDLARTMGWNTLIEGPTGPGKTTFVQAWAEREGLPFYSISSSTGLEPTQLFGKYIPNDDPDSTDKFTWQDGPVTDIVRHGGVLLINEINLIPDRVSTVLFSLLDSRREIQLVDHKGEQIRANDDCIIVADMNPGYAGTRELNAALRDRFVLKLDWGYDRAVEAQLLSSESLLELAWNLRAEAERGTYRTPISTRMLLTFEQLVVNASYEFASQNFLHAFAPHERSSVKLVLDTYEANVTSELIDTTDTDTDEDADDWGLQGVDWVYSDDSNDDATA